jgi:predicted ATPase
MRISFSGAANVGKTTLFNAFRKKWPMYTTPAKTYRDVIKENNLEHSSKTNAETQLHILNWMMEELKNYPKGSKVVYDRCPWDNLAYTLQGNATGLISDEVTAATISFVRESMKDLDFIFWLPFDPDIKIVSDALRDANPKFIKETDAIFRQLFEQYSDDLESDVFYPKEDSPAILEIFGKSVDDRLFYLSQFIDRNGELIETETSILAPENVDLLEQMLGDQTKQQTHDDELRQMMKNVKNIKI